MTRTGQRDRVPHNDYTALRPADVGAYEPRLSVSVVIPAFRCGDTLPLTLAALAAQSYPSGLMEVLVVDDGGGLELPEIRPEHTRVVPALPDGWGRAHACHSGAVAADGDVVHWLDADMVPYRDHVAAQLRWHHEAGYLMVMGYKRFVDFTPGCPAPERVRDAVAAGEADTLFDRAASVPHVWVERIIDRTDGLRSEGPGAYRVAVGATGSLTRAFYHEAGGMDTSLRLGEDTEFAYRLAQAGAVFVPEPLADSWHLGASTMMKDPGPPQRYNRPFMTDRVSQPRWQRNGSPRRHRVPYVEVMVDVAGAAYEDVAATVNGVLGGILEDVEVVLVGRWSSLHEGRRDLFGDPLLDLRLIREAYAADARVRLVETASPSPAVNAPATAETAPPPSPAANAPATAETAPPPSPAANAPVTAETQVSRVGLGGAMRGVVPFRLTCPAGWVPARDSLHRLTEEADAAGLGILDLTLPGSPPARLARTSAYRRARWVAAPGEDLDTVVAQLWGSRRDPGASWGLLPASEVPESGPPKDWRAMATAAKASLEKARTELEQLRQELDKPATRRARPYR